MSGHVVASSAAPVCRSALGWTTLGVNVCEWSGDLGQLVCPDPLSGPGTVRADSPGGTATATVNPPGGVGVPGTFTFSPPAGWLDVAAYRYSFGDDELTEVAADGDGRASVTWTPAAGGYVTLTVYAVKGDGTVSDYANWYSFEVAGTA
ncbi:hypothetical protein [Micromonospora sp. NPDC049282]|uniref:hypothetical protein n=1 Tax=Micromonospora sp. NPDC049282 TaxID=3364269 RepID=UPI00372281DF